VNEPANGVSEPLHGRVGSNESAHGFGVLAYFGRPVVNRVGREEKEARGLLGRPSVALLELENLIASPRAVVRSAPLGRLSESLPKDPGDGSFVPCRERVEPGIDEGSSESPVPVAEFQEAETERDSEKLLSLQKGTKRARRNVREARESEHVGADLRLHRRSLGSADGACARVLHASMSERGIRSESRRHP
jgi:hypothetical protein